ncbi:MAG TPA: pilus assembly protein TadG-related protein [Anaerolineales bacterium]|nr:pilus assembly protein TadG-related protein [Anaerolineales bacterium]
MNKYSRERGQALIVVALAIVGIAGIVGLVVDGGNAFLDRRNAQNAADSAALAAALTRIRGRQNLSEAALTNAAQNGYDNNGTSNTVEVHNPPIDGPNKGDSEYVQVVIVSHVKTYIAGILGWDQLTNKVEAVARTKAPEVRQILNGQAVISLAPTSDCDKHKSFWLHGEATLDITGGGVFVNSNNNQCAFVQQGSGSIRIRDNHFINVVGAAMIQKPQLLTPGVSVGAVPISYPPPFFMPKVGCGGEAVVSEDGTSMTAGSWDEAFPPEGVTHLDGGVYCLSEGMDITADLEGSNVVFKIEEGDVHWSSGANIVLDAPNNGDLAGLLLYVPMDNRNKIVLNGGSESNIRGTILAPASEVHINGNDSKAGFKSQIIGYTIDVNGISNVIINYKDELNYNTLSMPEVQLSE